MGYNIEETLRHAVENARPDYGKPGHQQGLCSPYVKRALVKGGLTYFQCSGGACAGGLEAQGFKEVANERTDKGDYLKGDIVVVSAYGSSVGHLAIWGGEFWISDYKQEARGKKVYPGPGYDVAKPKYKIYRYSGQ